MKQSAPVLLVASVMLGLGCSSRPEHRPDTPHPETLERPAKTEGPSDTPECSLSESALESRLDEISALLQGHCRQVEELSNGFAFRFEGGSQAHAAVTAIARKEEVCCPFLKWDIEKPEDDLFWVRLTGGKEFVREHFDLIQD